MIALEYSIWFKQRAECLFRLAQRALGEEFFHTRNVRLCDVTWQSQSHAVACETSWHLVMRDFTHTVVHDDDVQAVEQLALVLVDSLHMDVKHGGWVYFHPVFLLQVLGEFHLVVLWEKQNIHDLKTKEMKLLNHRCSLSWHAKCNVAMHKWIRL